MLAKINSIILFGVRIYKFSELCFISVFIVPFEKFIRKILKSADVEVNGPRDWDPQVKDTRAFFKAIANEPSLGFGETYMKGMWECSDLEGFIYRMFSSGAYTKVNIAFNGLVNYFRYSFLNLQDIDGSKVVALKHYDLGNDLFEAFLGPSMAYSCGYWRDSSNLEEAQLAKMKLIAEKLKLKPGMRVLDLGCGWGSLAKFLAEHYGVSVVGVTISEEGVKKCQELCAGLPIWLADYREVTGQFDRVVAVEILEHLGRRNYDTFFQVAERVLSDDGLFLLHLVGVDDPKMPTMDPFFHTYIIPNWTFPTPQDVVKCARGKFLIEDWQNFGNDFCKTFRAWHKNFINAWPSLKNGERDEMFFRMWSLYLVGAAAAFKARKYQVWHIVFSKNGLKGGYESIR